MKSYRIPAFSVALAAVALGCGGSNHPVDVPQGAIATRTSQAQLTSADIAAHPPEPYVAAADPRVSAYDGDGYLRVDMQDPPAGPETPSQWAKRYPDASRNLESFAHDHPQAAAELVELNREAPEHVRGLVRWAITHPYENVSTYVVGRVGWEAIEHLRSEEPDALGDFLSWCRASPFAAYELVTHSNGITADAYRTEGKAKRP